MLNPTYSKMGVKRSEHVGVENVGMVCPRHVKTGANGPNMLGVSNMLWWNRVHAMLDDIGRGKNVGTTI